MNFEFIEDLEKIKLLMDCSWSELSSFLDIDYSTLSRWKKGTSCPSKNTLEDIYNSIYKNKYRLNLLYEEHFKDLETKEDKILFHGSKEGIVGDLDISFSNDKKDFGKGFYLGESVKQAVSFVSSYKESCLYFLKLKNINELTIKEYGVTKEWMILVAYFRGRLEEYKDSKYLESLLSELKGVDVVIAPIADNSMYSIINEFIEGSITDLQCINSLSANRLGKQYVILNNDVLRNNIELLKKSYICSNEKEDYEFEKKVDKDLGKGKMILAKREYAGKGLYIEQILI